MPHIGNQSEFDYFRNAGLCEQTILVPFITAVAESDANHDAIKYLQLALAQSRD